VLTPASAVQLGIRRATPMDALVVEAGASDPRPDATGESASNPRPVREALGAIERAVSSIRIVPLLMGVGALWWGQTILIPIVSSVLVRLCARTRRRTSPSLARAAYSRGATAARCTHGRDRWNHLRAPRGGHRIWESPP